MVGKFGLAQPRVPPAARGSWPTLAELRSLFEQGIDGQFLQFERLEPKFGVKGMGLQALGRVGADGRDDLHAPLGPLREALFEPGTAERLVDLGRQLDGAADGLVFLARSTLPVASTAWVTFQARSRWAAFFSRACSAR